MTLRQLRFLTEVVHQVAGRGGSLHLPARRSPRFYGCWSDPSDCPCWNVGPVTGLRRRLLVDTSIRIEAELAVCHEALHSLRTAGGHVALAVSTAKCFAPQVLAAFQRTHPEVTIALRLKP
jgi:hypothetical protein